MKFLDKARIVVGVVGKWRELDDDFFRDLKKRLDDVDDRKKGNRKEPQPGGHVVGAG